MLNTFVSRINAVSETLMYHNVIYLEISIILHYVRFE